VAQTSQNIEIHVDLQRNEQKTSIYHPAAQVKIINPEEYYTVGKG
jgi:hypothetical protein